MLMPLPNAVPFDDNRYAVAIKKYSKVKDIAKRQAIRRLCRRTPVSDSITLLYACHRERQTTITKVIGLEGIGVSFVGYNNVNALEPKIASIARIRSAFPRRGMTQHRRAAPTALRAARFHGVVADAPDTKRVADSPIKAVTRHSYLNGTTQSLAPIVESGVPRNILFFCHTYCVPSVFVIGTITSGV